jgi:hypothetical protein
MSTAWLADDGERRRANVGEDERPVAGQSRVLALPPSAGRTAGIAAACALRYDPLKAELAGLREDDRALSVDRLAELDGVEPGDEGFPNCPSRR